MIAWKAFFLNIVWADWQSSLDSKRVGVKGRGRCFPHKAINAILNVLEGEQSSKDGGYHCLIGGGGKGIPIPWRLHCRKQTIPHTVADTIE